MKNDCSVFKYDNWSSSKIDDPKEYSEECFTIGDYTYIKDGIFYRKLNNKTGRFVGITEESYEKAKQ